MKIKIIFLAFLIVLASIVLPQSSSANSFSGIVISELSMGSAASATEEFVELYNNSSTSVSMANWSIYYRSATGTSYSKKASFATGSTLQPHSFFLVSTNKPSDLTLISGMSQTGGVVEIRDDKNSVMDRVGYGNASLSNGKPAVAVQSGESMYRQYDSPNTQMINTGDNFSDFYIATVLTPGAVPAVEIEDTSEPITYPPLTINELYPNPASDQSESSDEYIELYNPNNFDIDLNGWLIKDASGNTFVIKNKTIAAGSHAAIYSSETHLSLNNTGDTIRLYSPNNQLEDETVDYGDAKEGLSWGLVDGAWAWNNSPTPAAPNSSAYVQVVATKPVATKTTKIANKTTAKKLAIAKKASTKKAKASKLSAAKKAHASTATPAVTQQELQSKFANFWPWLMILLGTATIGYGIYEYKPEITNLYYRFKNK